MLWPFSFRFSWQRGQCRHPIIGTDGQEHGHGKVEQEERIDFHIGETLAGLQLGIICERIVSVLAYLWQSNIQLSMAVGLSMGISLILASLSVSWCP